MKKLFTSMALLLCASVSSVWAGDAFTLSLNDGATETRSDGSSDTYFTVVAGGKYNTNYTGTYNGITYTKGLKINSKSTVTFTTAATSTLTYVQSLSYNKDNATGLKNSAGTDLISDTKSRVDDETNKVGVYTYENLPAGTYTIYYGANKKETGLLYVSVEYTGNVLTQLDAPTITANTGTGEVKISYPENAYYVVYTTDGSDPTASTATKFEKGDTTITVEDGTTIKAMAIGNQETYSNSKIASETVYLDNVTIAEPVISSSNGVVAMSCETTGATIYYTTDGSEPSATNGNVFSYSFYTASDVTVKAIAVRGESSSNVASADVTGVAVASTVLLTGSNDAFKGANEVSFTVNEKTYTLKCGNSSKEYSASGNVYVDGATQTGIKLSNGASNTLTLPDGLVATKITLYSVINAASTGARTCGWKEVSGISDTEYKSYPMGAFNDLTSTNQTDIRTYELNNLSEIVFTNTGEQLMFVIALDVEEKATTETITCGTYTYKTYCSSNPLEFDEEGDYMAYTATYTASDDEITVTLTECASVPANTGVIIYNKAGVESSEIAIGSATETSNENALVGVINATTLPQVDGDNTNFILWTDGTFIKVKDNTTLGANRAYLPIKTTDIPTTGSAKVSIVFADDATGINEVKSPVANGKVYNLQGIEVQNPTKGLFIINGKKVVK